MATEVEKTAKPTNRQLAYMRDLNDRTGTSFNYPGTGARARREIDRLVALAGQQDLAIERFTTLCEDSGLPMFDTTEREGSIVRFIWTEQKLIVIIDLEEFDGEPVEEAAAVA